MRKIFRTGKTRPALRRTVGMGLVLLCAGALCAELVKIQVVEAPAKVAASKDKRAVPVVIPALRGNIVDRHGNLLVATKEVYDVQLSPAQAKAQDGAWILLDPQTRKRKKLNLKQSLNVIAEITGQDGEQLAQTVRQKLKKDPKADFAYVKRGVSLETFQELRALDIPWLTFTSVYTRTYPNGAVAGNLVGFVGAEGQAQAGIELSQNECLTGQDGKETYERSGDYVRLPGSTVKVKEMVPGGEIQLTIDRDLQWQTQQVVNARKAAHNAEWVLAVVMDVKTGQLLAVAEDNSVDPNDVSASDVTRRDARAFIMPYEPGSTFKTITTAALIDTGTATPATQNLTPDFWTPEPEVRFGDAFNHPPTRWTLTGILVNSSNVGISMLGNQLPKQVRYDYLQRFGIGQSTRAGMPLEDSGLLYNWTKWDSQSSYNIMFGQGVSATIVQTAGAYQAIANGGLRIPPTLVLSCTDAAGKVTKPEHGTPVQAISATTAQQLTGMLETLTHAKWASDSLATPGYRFAGKTGTAEQSDGRGGYRSDYVQSFAGFFPADNPQYVLVTSVAFPKSGNTNLSAVQTWQEIAQHVIRKYHVPQSTEPFTPWDLTY